MPSQGLWDAEVAGCKGKSLICCSKSSTSYFPSRTISETGSNTQASRSPLRPSGRSGQEMSLWSMPGELELHQLNFSLTEVKIIGCGALSDLCLDEDAGGRS